MIEKTLSFEEIARRAGFTPGADGRLSLPANDKTATELALAAEALLGTWSPGDEPVSVVLTGAGPVWAYLKVAHQLHGRAVRLVYAAPNATIVIWNHGA
jgi:hypothetical protein